MPTVSVIMPSYNHAPFVRAAIDSVLSQTFADFELLVSDDGSTDESAQVISAVKDPRVRFFDNRENRGACTVTNELVLASQGEFVALINSDDRWEPQKLERQLAYMAANPDVGACFSRVSWIDRHGQNLPASTIGFGSVFDQPNRSQAQWLRHFYFLGNCLCHPSVMIRRSCYERLGLYDNRLRQLPDFDMWVRLLRQYPIHILDEPLVQFRVMPGENVSSPTPVNSRRSAVELQFIFREFFTGVGPELLKAGFGDLMRNPDASGVAVEIEKAFLYFAPGLWNAGMYHSLGLEMLYRMLAIEPHRTILREQYAFDDRAFHALAGSGPAVQVPPGQAVDWRTVGGREMLRALLRRTGQRLGLSS